MSDPAVLSRSGSIIRASPRHASVAPGASHSQTRQGASHVGLPAPATEGMGNSVLGKRRMSRADRSSFALLRSPRAAEAVLHPTPLTAWEVAEARQAFDMHCPKEHVPSVVALEQLLDVLQVLLQPAVKVYVTAFFDQRRPHFGFVDLTQLLERLKTLHAKFVAKLRGEKLDHDLVEAFVAVGGNDDSTGCVDVDTLKRVAQQFNLQLDLDSATRQESAAPRKSVSEDGPPVVGIEPPTNKDIPFDNFVFLLRDAGNGRRFRSFFGGPRPLDGSTSGMETPRGYDAGRGRSSVYPTGGGGSRAKPADNSEAGEVDSEEDMDVPSAGAPAHVLAALEADQEALATLHAHHLRLASMAYIDDDDLSEMLMPRRSKSPKKRRAHQRPPYQSPYSSRPSPRSASGGGGVHLPALSSRSQEAESAPMTGSRELPGGAQLKMPPIRDPRRAFAVGNFTTTRRSKFAQ